MDKFVIKWKNFVTSLQCLKKLRVFFLNLSFFYKLLLSYLIIILIPIVLLVAISHSSSVKTTVNRTVYSSVQELRLITHSLEGLLKHINDLSKIIVINNLVQKTALKIDHVDSKTRFEYKNDIRDMLNSIVESRTVVSSVVLSLGDGTYFGCSNINTDEFAEEDHVTKEFHQKREEFVQRNWGKIVLLDTHTITYETTTDSTDVLTFLRPIIVAESGEPAGLLEINVAERTIKNFYKNLQYTKSGDYFIINNDGIIVSSLREDMMYHDISTFDYFEWITTTNAGGKIFEIGGRDMLVTADKFEQFNWALVRVVPLQQLMTGANQFKRIISLTGLISIVIAIVLALIVSKSMSRPLIDLSESMTAAGEGNLDLKVLYERDDEIGLLAKTYNKMLHRISYLMTKIYNIQRKKREYELSALQAQINPHFLYNTLDSVCSLALLNRPRDVYTMVKALAKFYRIALSKGKNVITIQEEIENLNNYLTIQKIRYTDKFDYTIQLTDDISEKKIIKLSLQPIVENAIYHGIKNKHGKGHIWIKSAKKKDNIQLIINDDGVGCDVEYVNSILGNNESSIRSTFGLHSVNERIKLYFGDDYGLTVESKENNGTTVIIILPSQNPEE